MSPMLPHDPADGPSRQVPAPDLREVAETRWDVERDPVVAWSSDGTVLWLEDSGDRDRRIELVRLAVAPDDPRAVAAALADTVAACDFPPTDDHASVPRVRAALRAAGFDPSIVHDDPDATATAG